MPYVPLYIYDAEIIPLVVFKETTSFFRGILHPVNLGKSIVYQNTVLSI